ncbi:MAG: 50S ribosomal protein L11 [Fimbriimonadaceae bacterium]|nr:50S ribosomal protein L11 [Fimbriimonadaceae bacterium]
MAKRIASIVKLNIAAGKGTPAPPVGPALGQAGINMMEFLKKFNEMTTPQMGYTLPVEITVFEDKSYSFVVKQPLSSDLIKQELGIQKGGSHQLKDKVATITQAQLEAVAAKKMADLNTTDIKAAAKIIAGTARNMGITVVD